MFLYSKFSRHDLHRSHAMYEEIKKKKSWWWWVVVGVVGYATQRRRAKTRDF